MPTMILVTEKNLKIGACVESHDGWRFIPAVTGRKGSRKSWPTAEECIPRWANKMGDGLVSVEAFDALTGRASAKPPQLHPFEQNVRKDFETQAQLLATELGVDISHVISMAALNLRTMRESIEKGRADDAEDIKAAREFYQKQQES